MNNLLDLTKNATTASKPKAKAKKGVPIIENLTNDEKSAVDHVRHAITAIKKGEADLENYGGIVRDLFLETKDTEARAGNFRKSFKFKGNKEVVMVKHANKALKINYADQSAIKKILGKDYDLLLEETAQISVKSEVLEPDSELGKKLLGMLGKSDKERNANFALFFESNVSLKIKEDFDRNIFRLPMKAFSALKVFVQMIRPGLQ